MDNVQALLREIQGEQPINIDQASGLSSRNSARSSPTFREDEHPSSTQGRHLAIGHPMFPTSLGARMPDLYLQDNRDEYLDDYGNLSLCVSKGGLLIDD